MARRRGTASTATLPPFLAWRSRMAPEPAVVVPASQDEKRVLLIRSSVRRRAICRRSRLGAGDTFAELLAHGAWTRRRRPCFARRKSVSCSSGPSSGGAPFADARALVQATPSQGPRAWRLDPPASSLLRKTKKRVLLIRSFVRRRAICRRSRLGAGDTFAGPSRMALVPPHLTAPAPPRSLPPHPDDPAPPRSLPPHPDAPAPPRSLPPHPDAPAPPISGA